MKKIDTIPTKPRVFNLETAKKINDVCFLMEDDKVYELIKLIGAVKNKQSVKTEIARIKASENEEEKSLVKRLEKYGQEFEEKFAECEANLEAAREKIAASTGKKPIRAFDLQSTFLIHLSSIAEDKNAINKYPGGITDFLADNPILLDFLASTKEELKDLSKDMSGIIDRIPPSSNSHIKERKPVVSSVSTKGM